MKKIFLKILGLVVWIGLFIYSMRYIGMQWEYEGLVSRGVIVGISVRSATHIFYSIATLAASAFIATTILAFLVLLFRRNRSSAQNAGLVFSILSIAIIAGAFYWNRRIIAMNQLPVIYRHYDSTGRLLEPEQHLKNLRKVNVILISIDTLNPKHLGAYGYDRNTSPTIDSLARQGVIFQNAFSQSPKTSPSHMSMFTSLYPAVHKIRNWDKSEGGYSLDHRILTLPEILKHAGYRTVAVTGGGNVQSFIGFGDGFDEYDNDEKVWSRAFEWLDQNHLPAQARLPKASGGQAGDSTFFMFLHTFKVHSPYLPPPPYNTMFGEKYDGKIVDSEQGLHQLYKTNYKPDDPFPGSHDLFWSVVDKNDPRDVQRLIDQYDGCIRFMNDHMLGVLLNRLKKYDLDKNTLLIFTADHGEEFLQHGDFLHKELYDEHIHVPLIIKFPDGDALNQRSIRQQVAMIDLMPTILEYLELPIPEMVQGTSLFSIMAGKDLNLPVFSERIALGDVPDYKKSIRTLDWKYIFWPTQKVEELYNLPPDAGEKVNVAKTSPEVAADFNRQLIEWMNDNTQRGQSIRTITQEFDKETIEKLRSLGYIR
ncbi:MAG TPA: sulfatase-like hydrolase/transferase [bacterium]